jgi:hypothetical protein
MQINRLSIVNTECNIIESVSSNIVTLVYARPAVVWIEAEAAVGKSCLWHPISNNPKANELYNILIESS